MNIGMSRLLMAPVLAGALFGVTMMDTQGTAEAAGPWWKAKGKPAGIDCRFSFRAKDIDVDNSENVRNLEDSGSVCGTKVTHKNWLGIYQWGKFNQANAAVLSQNIVQIANVPDGNNSDIENEAEENSVGIFTENVSHFLQANVNVAKNRINHKADDSQEAIDINIEANN